MNPILIKLGPIQVHWYGVLIVLGAVIAAWVCTKEAARRGEDPDHVWNLLTWALVFGIIGARLYHVFSTPTGNFAGWAYYREHPLEIIAFWHGGFRGLGIYGAVIGGVLAFFLYTQFLARDKEGKRVRLNFWRWLDIASPGLLLAQAIGRMGNYINQELYGPPTNLPWAFHINPLYPCQEPPGSPQACGLPDRLTDSAREWYATHGFHPTFFYEAIWNLVGFALLMILGRRLVRWLRDGDIFFMYLIWYPVGRFWVEMFRPDAWRLGTLATAQWIAIIGVLLGIAGLIVNHVVRKPAPAQAEVGADEAPGDEIPTEIPAGETSATETSSDGTADDEESGPAE
jgi:phosphatidylglycerol:prolipoprotein diacylglycerol transferase